MLYILAITYVLISGVLNVISLLILLGKLEKYTLSELMNEEIKEITWLELILYIIFLLPFVLLVGLCYIISKTNIWSKLNSKIFKEDKKYV